jgi:hypothetical protein
VKHFSCRCKWILTSISSTAYRSGVTLAITSSLSDVTLLGPSSIIAGLSTTFRTGVVDSFKNDFILQGVAALHVSLGHEAPYARWIGPHILPRPSVSTQIAALRRLLKGEERRDTETGKWFYEAAMVGRTGVIRPVPSDQSSGQYTPSHQCRQQ